MKRTALWCVALLAVAFAVGCGNDETVVDPVGGGAGGAAGSNALPDAGADASPPVADAGPVVRTVEQRDPFGHTSVADNLLVDGDFELTSANGQYGWIAFAAGAQADLVRETGGLCRSGVTCGVITPGTSLLAYGAAPDKKSLQVTLYAKPPHPDCDLLGVSLISCVDMVQSIAIVEPVALKPDASGWCEYQGVSSPMQQEPCLFLSSYAQTGERTLIDDASLVAADAPGAKALAATVPSPALYHRIAEVLDWTSRHRRYGRPAPSRP